MKFNVNIQVDIKKPDQVPTETDWPTMPFEPDSALVPNLTVNLFDGSTEPDPANPGGFRVMACYDGSPTLTFNGGPYLRWEVFGDGVGQNLWYVTYKQNQMTIDPAEISTSWGVASGTNQAAAFTSATSRQPLKLVRAPGLFNANGALVTDDKVFRLGVEYPNIQVQLMADISTVISQADLVGANQGGDYTVANPMSDPGAAGENLGYFWPNTPTRGCHIAVQEKSCKTIRNIAVVAADPLTTNGPLKFGSTLTIEGPHWNSFNTADATNFKITQTPNYGDPAVTGTFLTFFQTANSMNVYLIPRRWWFYSRFRDLPNKQDHCWGYWARPPQNLMMPEPRFSGTWQQSCPSNADVVDAGNTMGSGSPRMEIDFSQQSNWMINWSFAGDSINTNAYYILSCDCQGNDTFPKPSYFDPIPTGGSFVNAYVQYTATSGNSATGVPMVEIFSVNNPNGVPAYSPWPWPASSFYGSMPDGKVPNMLAQITFSPSEWPPGWNTYWVGPRGSRSQLAYDKTAFVSTETTKVSSILSYFMQRPTIKDDVIPGSLMAWSVSMGPALTGDLVGVIENVGQLYFVWRKTNEQLANLEQTAVVMPGGNEGYVFSSEIYGSFNYGLFYIANASGHIQMQFPGPNQNSQGQQLITTLYTGWGYGIPGTTTSGQSIQGPFVSLGTGVVPLLAFDADPTNFTNQAGYPQ